MMLLSKSHDVFAVKKTLHKFRKLFIYGSVLSVFVWYGIKSSPMIAFTRFRTNTCFSTWSSMAILRVSKHFSGNVLVPQGETLTYKQPWHFYDNFVLRGFYDRCRKLYLGRGFQIFHPVLLSRNVNKCNLSPRD